ncbi:MAG: SulP family inorganic anion transporter [Desulfobacterales bacterium]
MHVHPDSFVPFISWIRQYRRHHLKADVFAGLTVAVVALPQSMAYAIIAGLPVQYGLYASIMPAIVGSLWGSSAHLVTGPTTAASLVVFSILSQIAQPGTAAYIELALFLALVIGLLKIIMGIARFGALLNFVSHSVLLGFTAGAAVLIAFKQIPGLLGMRIDPGGHFAAQVLHLLMNLGSVHWPTVLLGMLTIAIILAGKWIRSNFPATLLAMVAVSAIVAALDLERHGVGVVGAIPRSLPPFSPPSMEAAVHIRQMAPGALAIAILGLVEAVSIAKSIADQTRQRLNVNREFIGQGLANVVASLFSGYPTSGSFTRSAVNFKAGAKTPLSGVVSGLAVAAAILAISPLAAVLPHAALAGVLIVVAYELIRFRDIARAIRATRSDAAVLIITFFSMLLLSIEFAIYVGILLSIVLHLAKTSHPRIYSVVPDPATGKMVGSAYGETCCQMDIIQIEGSMFFGSASFILEDLQHRLRSHPGIANLLIRMHHVNILDASGVHILEIILEEVRRRGGGVFLSGVNHRVFEVVKNASLLKDIGENHIRKTTGSAIRRAMQENFCPAICAACQYDVFLECPDLKVGNWEIFGEGVQPRICPLPEQQESQA